MNRRNVNKVVNIVIKVVTSLANLGEENMELSIREKFKDATA